MEKKRAETEGLNTIRINKYLSDAGVCSRREADRLIEAGRVTVGGKVLKMGERISPDAPVCVDEKPVTPHGQPTLLLFYKPRGIVCSTRTFPGQTTVTEYLDYPIRIYPAGRLDKESEGLLLMTNEGDLVNRIMRAGNCHEKEYQVMVDKPLTPEFLQGMRGGVPILDTVTRPCPVEQTGKKQFRIILTQGLNRQIRRMCEYFGYRVVSLKRVRIMHLTLDGLKPGEYREITAEERAQLMKSLSGSMNETVKKTGGQHGSIHSENERTGRKAQPGRKGVLSGRPGNHEQSGVRCSVRSTGNHGKRNRSGAGKQPNRKGRV